MEDIIISHKHLCSSYISMPKGLPDYYVLDKAALANKQSMIDQHCDDKRIIFTDINDDCYWICDVNETDYAFKLRVYKK